MIEMQFIIPGRECERGQGGEAVRGVVEPGAATAVAATIAALQIGAGD